MVGARRNAAWINIRRAIENLRVKRLLGHIIF
jgi:hypothetical protein